MTIVNLKAYHALPCECEIFVINNVDADVDDFGSVDDLNTDEAEDYGCGDMQFVPKMPTDEVLAKYSINLKDYSEICKMLSKELSVGSCGWCV